MEDGDFDLTVMWREGERRCEFWRAGVVTELRVYVSDVLIYREPVLGGSEALRQAAALLVRAQAAMGDRRR